MWNAARSAWPLLLGMVLLMISNGLLVTLLTLRGLDIGLGERVIGLVQAAYPVGAIAGCVIVPRLVTQVGHVRTFAAMASVASCSTLIHLVTQDALTWGAMRAVSGFCFAGLYVVAESWLNGRATNATRAGLLSVYFVIQMLGATAGQGLLGLGEPSGTLLLVVASTLISLAVVPVLLSASASPPFDPPERMALRDLLVRSPMALAGCTLNGIAQGALYVGLGLYGSVAGLGGGAVGALVGGLTLGGMLLQFPIGRLSDRIDRRLVIVAAALAGAGLASLLAAVGTSAGRAPLYLGVAALGGLVLPLYAICIAQANDRLQPGQIVAASGTLVLLLNVGIMLGPILVTLAISAFGPAGLFGLIAIVQASTAMVGGVRLARQRSPLEDQGVAPALSQYGTPVAARLNPESDEGTR